MSVTLSLDDVYELALRALTGSQVSDTNAHPVADPIRSTEADGMTQAGLWPILNRARTAAFSATPRSC